MKKEYQQKHYLYKITLLCGSRKGYYYYGKHSTKKGRNPDSDIYWGSGTIIKEYIKKYGAIDGVTLHKEILEYNATVDENNSREQEVIGDRWKTEPLCINLKAGGTTGAEYSEEARAKISKALTGYKHSKESRRHMSEGHMGQKPWNKGIPQTEEQRKKNSECHKGLNHTQEWKDAMSEKMKGRPHGPMSEETKKKLSEKLKGRKMSIESRKKMSETRKGRKLVAEHAKHVGDACKKRMSKSVVMINADGRTEFYSRAEASRQTGISETMIYTRIQRHIPDTKGNMWEYVN